MAMEIESCIKQTHVNVTQHYPHGACLEIKGGVACFADFDSFFSQVIGWGFATTSQQFATELETIEHFYQKLNHPRVDIEVCPFIGNELVVLLSERGYGISELNTISVLNLKKYQSVTDVEDHFIIKEIKPAERNQWVKIVAEGFGYPEAQEQFSHYIKATGVATFGAYYRNELIAGGTIALHGRVGDLAVTSVLPAFRGQGLQKKLIHARLNFAQQHGLSLATVTTEPGSVSDYNVQKTGFHCAYTRIKMTRQYSEH